LSIELRESRLEIRIKCIILKELEREYNISQLSIKKLMGIINNNISY